MLAENNPNDKPTPICGAYNLPFRMCVTYFRYLFNHPYNTACKVLLKRRRRGASLVVLWLRLCAPNVGGVGSIPGRGTKIPHAMW